MQNVSRQKISRRALLKGGFILLLSGCSHGQSGNLGFSIGVRGEGNQLVIVHDAPGATSNNTSGDMSVSGENAFVVIVTSDSGIGEGTVAWWGNTTPHHLSFQLHLNALEHFNLRWGKEKITVNVNSTESFVIESVSDQDGEAEIDADSPYWIEVTPPSDQQSYFLLTAPEAFLKDSPSLFAISWIDYYR
jgi:hypothetical protein